MEEQHPRRSAPPWPRARRAAVHVRVGPRRGVVGVALVLFLAACSAGAPDPTPSPSAGGSSPAPAATASASPGPSVPPSATTTPPAPDPSAPDDDTSTVGALPDGFPVDLLPLPADGDVLVAVYVPLGPPGPGEPYDVSLNVRTASAVADVVALYRASLTAAGFTETVGAPPPGTLAAESTYTRTSGEELLVVGVLDRDGTRTVTVGGRVRASG